MWYLAPINHPTDWMWWAYPIVNDPWEILLRLGIDTAVIVSVVQSLLSSG